MPSEGPNSCDTAGNQAIGGSLASWTSATNVTASDNSYAEASWSMSWAVLETGAVGR